jgi:hypothetical protein
MGVLSKKDHEDIEKQDFVLLKDITILAGTVFGSSIALSVGRDVEMVFVVGEFFLLLSVIFGFIFLWARNRGDEGMYFLDQIMKLKEDVRATKDKPEFEFINKTSSELLFDLERLYNKKTFLSYFLKIIKIDSIPTLFYLTFLLGILFIWLSLFSSKLTILSACVSNLGGV